MKKRWLADYYPLFLTLLSMSVIVQYSFPTLESILYDWRIRLDYNSPISNEIVWVTADEQSDEFLGESFPYSYGLEKRALEEIFKNSPQAIVYLKQLELPRNENDQIEYHAFISQLLLYQMRGGIVRFSRFIKDNEIVVPPKDFIDIGVSFSHLHMDNNLFANDQIYRRALLDIAGEESIYLYIANKMRLKQKQRAVSASSILGASYLPSADATFVNIRYPFDPITFSQNHRISYHRLVDGAYPTDFFRNKIVLIGRQYESSAEDYIKSPFNRESLGASRIAISAATIIALMENRSIYAIPRSVSNTLAFMIVFFLSLIISRARPTRGLIVTILAILAMVIAAYLLWILFGFWLYLTHILLAIIIVYYIWVPFRAMAEYQRRYAIQEESALFKKVEGLKQNFISFMSHDLKTPVAKIAGIADNLKQQYGSNLEISKNADHILDATRELNRFISSILDLTKIESKNFTLNLVSKDINTVIENVIESLRYEAREADIYVEFVPAPLYPIHIDAILMHRVLSNLIENAIKYSGRGRSIHIHTSDDSEYVYIEIRDTGVGIKSEDLQFIFEKFYRVKNDASHSIKGSGLGLYLVKYFLELHGGTISVSSVVGEGTTFQIRLNNK